MSTSLFVPTDLQEALSEALNTLLAATELDPDALFGTRVVEDMGTLPGPAAHAAGLIEGAALAFGLTALELLDLLPDGTSIRSPIT